jgi:voltage-gated potassium channel
MQLVNVRVALLAVTRIGVVIAGLLVVYWLLPVQDHVDGGWALRLVGGLALTGGVIVWEVFAIERSKRPFVRAIEALAASLCVFIVVFSITYLAISHARPDSFSEHLDKVSAMYFVVTTLATVGYGDITPTTHTTQVLATIQMLLDLVVIAVTARVLLRVANTALSKRRSSEQATDEQPNPAG